MPIEFPCPGCRKVLRVADSAAGKKARCPDCSTVSDVPQTASGTTPDFSSFGSGSSAGSSESSWPSGGWSPEENQPASNAPSGGGQAGNPFAQRPTPENADNPFASPQPSYSAFQGPGLNAIRERVKGPAICLIVVAGISVALTLASLAFNLIAGAGAFGQGMQNRGGGGPADVLIMLTVGVVPAIIQLIRAGFIIYGALQMKNLESHGLAMAAAIIAVVPCFSACCLLDLPFGIWALVVLNDEKVKQAFAMARRS